VVGGADWWNLGQGVTGTVYAMVRYQDRLVVGGSLTQAGGQAAQNIAMWTGPGVPGITMQPRDQLTDPSGEAEITLEVAGGYPGLVFQWRHGDSVVTDGPGGASPGGGTVSGATTSTIQISGVRLSDCGLYACTISNACGYVNSNAVELRIACAADWNGDLAVNSADIAAFLTSWLASIQSGATEGDFNSDGMVNSLDISTFLQSWLEAIAGAC